MFKHSFFTLIVKEWELITEVETENIVYSTAQCTPGAKHIFISNLIKYIFAKNNRKQILEGPFDQRFCPVLAGGGFRYIIYIYIYIYSTRVLSTTRLKTSRLTSHNFSFSFYWLCPAIEGGGGSLPFTLSLYCLWSRRKFRNSHDETADRTKETFFRGFQLIYF